MQSIAGSLWRLRDWRRQRILRRSGLSDLAWSTVVADLSVLRGLSGAELDRLRDLVVLFLHGKRFQLIGESEIDDHMRLTIAAQACLLVLNLGLRYYRGWTSIIVYPDSYLSRRQVRDQAGVVHTVDSPLVGEAWEQGPVVLSWRDVLMSGDGFNVVVHEFAHKLDMLNGDVNGYPPLHSDMEPSWWARVFNHAYADFCRQVDAGDGTYFDPYGAENPGEFFAVMSEAFFELPELLSEHYPAVYRQLSLFYRQQPLQRRL